MSKIKDLFLNELNKKDVNKIFEVKDEIYFTKKDLAKIKKEVTPIKGVDYRDGKDGKNYILTKKDITQIVNKVAPMVQPVEGVDYVLPTADEISKRVLKEIPTPEIEYSKIESIVKKLVKEKAPVKVQEKLDINKILEKIKKEISVYDLKDGKGFKYFRGGGASFAHELPTDTKNFSGNLSSSDTTVQKALETLDQLTAGGGSFISMSDTPSSYTGNAGKFAKVNATEDGLEFGDGDGVGDMLKAVYDTNNSGIVDDSEKLNGQDASYYAKESEVEKKVNKGQANGYASLDGSGKVPASQLPSYVDDVEEYDTQGDFPTTGETGKIYVAKDTNKTYRWSGSSYIELSSVDLALNDLSDVDTSSQDDGKTLTYNATSGKWEAQTPASGVTDHGLLSGLDDDDHTQYHTDARADTWLGTKDTDDLAEGTTNKYMTSTEKTKLAGIEDNAEVNNISDTNATDLTDGGDSSLHYHSADRNRANHTGTQTASTISDFDTEVSNNSDVSANTSARHTHSNKTTLDAIEEAYTTAEKNKLNGIETNADVTDAENIEDAITGTDEVITSEDADTFATVVSNALKKVTWANIKATLKTYFDTLYGDMDNPMTAQGDVIYGGTSGNPTRLAKGTDGQVLTLANGVPSWADASGGSSDFIILEDQKPDGTEGGTSYKNAWYDRVLNTEVMDTGNHCSLSSNQFTLEAGTYKIFVTSPFDASSGGSIRLYNVSDSSTEVLGTLFSCSDGQGSIKGKFTITNSKTFKIQYWINNNKSGHGLGRGYWSDGEINVFTRVFLEKIA